MKDKAKLLCVFFITIFYGFPVYGVGYEDVSLAKIILQLVFYIVVFAIVVFFTIYGTKIIAKNFKGITSSKYMKLLDILNIPGGAKIVLVKMNDKIYVLSTNNNGMNVIDIIDEENFTIEEENFNNYLSKYLNSKENGFKLNSKVEGVFNKFYIKKDKEDSKDEKNY